MASAGGALVYCRSACSLPLPACADQSVERNAAQRTSERRTWPLRIAAAAWRHLATAFSLGGRLSQPPEGCALSEALTLQVAKT